MAGPLQRLSHAGAAVPSALANPLGIGGMSFVITQIAGWPTGAGSQPFGIVINPGGSNEEKILCASQASGNVNVAANGRGADGTVQSSHNAGEVVEHVFFAAEADDANAHIYDPSRDDHLYYARVDGTRPFTGVTTFNAGINVTGPTNVTGNLTLTGNETVSGALGVAGLVSAQALAVAGLTGAATPSRYVGATTGGAPTTGTFLVGDWVIDRTGAIWVCTTAGSPGTWVGMGPGLPPPVTSGTTVVSYIDPTGEVWVAKNGVNGGAYKKARDVIHARVNRAAAITVTSSQTTIAYDTVTRDPYGMLSGGGLIVPIPGLYLVSNCHGAGITPGMIFQNQLMKNGVITTAATAGSATGGTSNVFHYPHNVDTMYCNAGDIIGGSAYLLSGSSLALVTASTVSYLTLDYLGTG